MLPFKDGRNCWHVDMSPIEGHGREITCGLKSWTLKDTTFWAFSHYNLYYKQAVIIWNPVDVALPCMSVYWWTLHFHGDLFQGSHQNEYLGCKDNLSNIFSWTSLGFRHANQLSEIWILDTDWLADTLKSRDTRASKKSELQKTPPSPWDRFPTFFPQESIIGGSP